MTTGKPNVSITKRGFLFRNKEADWHKMVLTMIGIMK